MTQSLADPERELAISYAPPSRRAALRALWLFDEKLGGIVAGTTEPTIGEMRLLWWREALEKADNHDRGEPLLDMIGRLTPPPAIDPSAWAKISEGWHALLQEPLEEEEIRRFGTERGGRLFALSAEILAGEIPDGVKMAGSAWALADVARRSRNSGIGILARSVAGESLAGIPIKDWPAALRPLGALFVVARRDLRSGAAKGRQGSPGRVARMAWHRMTGR